MICLRAEEGRFIEYPSDPAPIKLHGEGLHDTNRSGAWWLLSLISIIGWIIVIVIQALRSDPAGRRFDRARP
ncbi:DUF805 domain-containing protein [Microbacterium sp. ASV49]|uniref:DUF805 domain-containing protein n=1 Tax=Microbacterium candidum TaxID=3041922 RepID=UPI00336AC726